VGDLIRVSNKQPLPADVVVLATGEDDNVCYIETSSIDGETNLKLRRYCTHTHTHIERERDKDQGKMYHLSGCMSVA
jgi:P-type E1-E2 ATPase